MHLTQRFVFALTCLPDPSCVCDGLLVCPVDGVDVAWFVAAFAADFAGLGASFGAGASTAGCGDFPVVVVCPAGPAPGDFGPIAVAASGCAAGKSSQWQIAKMSVVVPVKNVMAPLVAMAAPAVHTGTPKMAPPPVADMLAPPDIMEPPMIIWTPPDAISARLFPMMNLRVGMGNAPVAAATSEATDPKGTKLMVAPAANPPTTCP